MGKLLLILITVPLIETWFLIELGGIVGALPTIALVITTAVIGGALVRRQGTETWLRAQQEMQRGATPATEMMEGMAILFAGALLITPGFFTDATGFLLLFPPFRRSIARHFARKFAEQIVVQGSSQSGFGGGFETGDPFRQPPGGDYIDGEFREEAERPADQLPNHDGNPDRKL